MSTRQRVVFAFACFALLAGSLPALAHDGYGRPRGYDSYRHPSYHYQPPVVYRPPPVFYRPWPTFEPEYYWRKRHRHGDPRW